MLKIVKEKLGELLKFNRREQASRKLVTIILYWCNFSFSIKYSSSFLISAINVSKICYKKIVFYLIIDFLIYVVPHTCEL